MKEVGIGRWSRKRDGEGRGVGEKYRGDENKKEVGIGRYSRKRDGGGGRRERGAGA